MDLCAPVLSAMREWEVPLSDLTYCILIKGHGRAGDVQRVRTTYRVMLRRSVRPDLATFNALLDAFARNGEMREAEGVLSDMGRHGVRPSTRSFNTLLKGYARAGRLRGAFHVVRRMRQQLGPRAPNEVTYNTLVAA